MLHLFQATISQLEALDIACERKVIKLCYLRIPSYSNLTGDRMECGFRQLLLISTAWQIPLWGVECLQPTRIFCP